MSTDSTRILTSVQSRGALPMLGAYVRAYPGRSAAAIGAVLVAGLMDGLGLSMLLSMLSLATREARPAAVAAGAGRDARRRVPRPAADARRCCCRSRSC